MKAALDQHLRPTLPVRLKTGARLEIHRVTFPKGSNDVCLHAAGETIHGGGESVLKISDLLEAREVGWLPRSSIHQPMLPSMGHGEEFASVRSRCFASVRPGAGRKAVILDARARTYTAMLDSGWDPRDVLILEELPLTAAYQLALGAQVLCCRLEELLHRPPAEPAWVEQHVRETVAVYVDLCGDCEGFQWKTPLSEALSSLPNLETYMVTRKYDSVGRVPCLPEFVEIDSFCSRESRVECFVFHRGSDADVIDLLQRFNNARLTLPIGQRYSQVSSKQWQCEVCLRIEPSAGECPERCFHCHQFGSMKLRRWCSRCKTRSSSESYRSDLEDADLLYCGTCWKYQSRHGWSS